MNSYRMKALEQLLDYISGMQGSDLKSLMESQSDIESPGMELSEEDAPQIEVTDPIPKGMDGEEVIIQESSMPDDMQDDEMEELYRMFRK